MNYLNTAANPLCKKTAASLPSLLLEKAAAPPGIHAHLESCPDCAAELASLEATLLLMEEWTAPEPSPYFDTKLAARLREERSTAPAGFLERWRARLLYGGSIEMRPAAAGALALLLLIGGGTYAGFESTHRGVSQSSPTVRDLQSLDENAQVYQQLNAIDDTEDAGSSM